MSILRDRRVLIGAGVGVLLLAGIVAIAIINSEPDKCVMNGPFGPIEYDCERVGGNSASTSDGSWWVSDEAQAVYAFVGLAASAAGGGYAYWRHRTRRERLQEYMRRIDDTLAAHKARPGEGARAVAAVRSELRAAFRAGRIDDGHFLELDKRATAGILKLRYLELDQRFPVLPPGLRNQVVTLLGDGSISDAEVQLVRTSLATQLIPGRVRDEILILLDGWARQDAGTPGALDPEQEPAIVVQLKET